MTGTISGSIPRLAASFIPEKAVGIPATVHLKRSRPEPPAPIPERMRQFRGLPALAGAGRIKGCIHSFAIGFICR